MRIFLRIALVLALVLALILGLPAAALAANQKLVMKDGTYQIVRSYERRGDRVRFFSIERNEWEEVPAALVDWEATGRVNKQEQTEAEGKVQQAVETDKAAASAIADERFGLEVAPGLRLPDQDGLFVVVGGKAVALPKQQASARIDKGRVLTNIVLPVPVLKNRSLVEIPGAKSELRLAASPAALYANGRARDDSRFVIARLKTRGDKRQIGAISTNMLGRNPQHSGDYIELKQESLGSDVFRLTPARSLPAGEYAIVEFLGNDLNLFLWDFAVEK